MSHKFELLYIINKQIPPTDYRLIYSRVSKLSSVIYGLPSKPTDLSENKYVRMGFKEGLRPSYFYHFLLLWRYLFQNRKKLDFVHFFSTNLILFGPMIAKMAGTPSLVTVTGFGRVFSSSSRKYKLLRPVYMLLMSLSLRCAHRVLFQNHGDLNWLANRFPDFSHKFKYVGSAVSMPVLKKDKSFFAPKIRVLLVARLMPDKGIDDFIQVAEALHRPEFEFVLVGPTSVGFDELASRVKEYHQRGIIDYKGELESDDTLEEFEKSHVFYFPSYGEGMARVMLEAGFARTCPIAYDIPANRDLIDDSRGFLVKRGDVEQVLSILNSLSSDRKKIKKCALEYQIFIKTNYNIDVYSQKIDNIMLEVARELHI